MTVICLNGHASESEDYCDTCGEPIGAAAPPTPLPEPSPPEPEPSQVLCPTCGFTAAARALFCENCGHDFTTGASPEPVSSLDLPSSEPLAPTSAESEEPAQVSSPMSVSEDPEPSAEMSASVEPPEAEVPVEVPVETSASVESSATGSEAPATAVDPFANVSVPSAATSSESVSGQVSFTKPSILSPTSTGSTENTSTWVAEIWIDPDWYAVQESDEPMPSAGPPSLVVLRGRSILVGRHSNSRGISPEIDCGTDSGVSRRHCQLTTDGDRWWVEDLQSSNGTYLGAADGPLPTDPIPPRIRRELDDGKRLYVGAFTRLVIREALPGEA